MKATLYLNYNTVKNNLDSLLNDAYKLPYKHISKAESIPEKVFVNPAKKIGSFFWKKGDVGIIDRFGPDGVSKLVKIISNKTARLQTGFIYDYAFVMLLGLSILLTYLILK